MRQGVSFSVVVAAVLCVATADGGKVRNALFNIFGGKKEAIPEDADQAELIEFLKSNGLAEYASQAWVTKLDEELAYDTIEDLTHIVAEEEYSEIGLDLAVATKMQVAARSHMLKVFLADVPVPEGAAADAFKKLLEPLLAAGVDLIESVAELDAAKAEKIGIDNFPTLKRHADEYDARELLQIILKSYEPDDSAEAIAANPPKDNPFASEAVWRPLVDALVAAGVRKLSDILSLSPSPGVSKEHLELLKVDKRVRQHGVKQEL